MANTFATPDTIARMALATLYNDSIMLPLVSRDFDGDFTAAQGDQIITVACRHIDIVQHGNDRQATLLT